MAEKILDVPYFTQPTSNTCQSTCLKMFGHYLAGRLAMSSMVHGQPITGIWKEINESEERPSQVRNSYQNMVWWLNKYFPSYNFLVKETRNTDEAMLYVVNKINAGFPVMVSTNHSRTSGHIILVIGYKNHYANQSSSVEFVCHDPYGKFDPQLGSNTFGTRRYSEGRSVMEGGEVGPGKSVTYNNQGIRRIRADKHSNGTYFLISGNA